MGALEVIERSVSGKIENDLRRIDELSEVSSDPLGYAVYLYFLLKNQRRSAEVDNLIDWMNSWIENIIVQRNFSRFVDVELTSALLAHFSLKTFERLKVDVEVETLKQLVSEYMEDGHFFNNFTLSSIITLALSDFRNDMENYPNLLTWIQNKVDEKTVFNDAKNLVFTSILFERVNREDYVRKTFDYCFEKLLENNIPYYDELYYAFVLWKFKELRGRKQNIQRIREFTEKSIMNAKKLVQEENVDESVEEVYGIDVQRAASKINLSKIYLGVLLDLLIDFSEKTVRISKEELTRKDIPIWIRMGSLLSGMIFFLNMFVLLLSFQLGIVRRASVDLSNLTWYSAQPLVSQLMINWLFFMLVVFLGTTSVSLFWDIVFEGSVNSKVIKNNLRTRLRKIIAWQVLIPLIFGFLEALIGI